MARFFTLGILVGLSCVASLSPSAFAQPPAASYPGPAPEAAGYNPYAAPALGGYGEYCPPGMPPAGVYAETPEETVWFSRVDPLRKRYRSFDGWFIRTEYLNWDYDRPGDVLLGSRVLSVRNPRRPFPVYDDQIPPTDLGDAFVPFLDEMRLDDASGVRGTIGIPLTFGSFEASVFGFGKKEETVGFFDTEIWDPILNEVRPLFTGTSTLENGLVSNNIFLYNDGFEATFTSQFYGAEANVFVDGSQTNYFFFKPFVGFRYFNLEENLFQTGRFVPDPDLMQPTVTSEIDSRSKNRIYAPQIGLRMQFESRWVSFAFDPKFALGANDYFNRVRTNDLRGLGDPEVVTTDGATQITPVIDLGFTGKLHVTQHLSLTAGYNFLWLGGITRPQNNIYYNDNGPLPTPPGVVVETKKGDMKFQGISVGAELNF